MIGLDQFPPGDRPFTPLLILAAALAGCGAHSALAVDQRDAGAGGHGGASSTVSSSVASSSAASSGGGAGGAPGCTSDAECGCELSCCAGRCVNLQNDIANCGSCGVSCGGEHPFCAMGTCGAPPCGAGAACGPGTFCCAAQCCAAGQLCCTTHSACCDFTECHDPTPEGTCPVGSPCTQCAAPETPIATPEGPRPIASLRVGDLVYSVARGAVVIVPVRETHRTPVRNHRVMQVLLDDGTVLRISPRHPTADGRAFAGLRAGDRLGDVPVAAVGTIAYDEPFTYDILPDSDSGAYFAGGALIGSTLHGGTAAACAGPGGAQGQDAPQ